MDLGALMDSRYFTYLVLPILIFAARVLDVTLGTIRIATGIIKKYHPQALYSVEDVRQVSRGVFPARKPV